MDTLTVTFNNINESVDIFTAPTTIPTTDDASINDRLQQYLQYLIIEQNIFNELSKLNTKYSAFFLKLFKHPSFELRKFYADVCTHITTPSDASSETSPTDRHNRIYNQYIKPVLSNVSLIKLNDTSSFGANKNIFNELAYEYSQLFPQAGLYHLLIDVYSNITDTITTTYTIPCNLCHKHTTFKHLSEQLICHDNIASKVGMVKNHQNLLSDRLLGYERYPSECARKENYYTNTVFDCLLSIHRSNLPPTEAEGLHNTIACGNVQSLYQYRDRLLHPIPKSFNYIINYIQHCPDECTILDEYLVSTDGRSGSGMLSKNYSKDYVPNVSTDKPYSKNEICILKFWNIPCERIAVHIIRCSEFAAIIDSICPNGYLAVDSIIYETDNGNLSMDTIDERVLTHLQQIDTFCDHLSELFRKIDIQEEALNILLQKGVKLSCLKHLTDLSEVKTWTETPTADVRQRKNAPVINASDRRQRPTTDRHEALINNLSSKIAEKYTYIPPTAEDLQKHLKTDHISQYPWKYLLNPFKDTSIIEGAENKHNSNDFNKMFQCLLSAVKSNANRPNVIQFSDIQKGSIIRALSNHSYKAAADVLNSCKNNLNTFNPSVDQYIMQNMAPIIDILFRSDILTHFNVNLSF